MSTAGLTVATALGFDVGAKRIGIAVGNGFSGTARDLSVVDMRDEVADWVAIDKLVREWRPDALVVGDPRTQGEDDRQSDPVGSGPTQPSRQRAQRFARDAATRYPLPVWLMDERMSSIDAAARFAQGRAAGARKRSAARNLDAVAAAIILERWLGAPQDADRVVAGAAETRALDDNPVPASKPPSPQ